MIYSITIVIIPIVFLIGALAILSHLATTAGQKSMSRKNPPDSKLAAYNVTQFPKQFILKWYPLRFTK